MGNALFRFISLITFDDLPNNNVINRLRSVGKFDRNPFLWSGAASKRLSALYNSLMKHAA